MYHGELVTSATTAGVHLLKLRQFSSDGGLNRLAYGAGLATVQYLDAHLVESHQGPQPHSACNQLLNALAGQILHRRHTTALLVWYIGYDPHILDDTFLN
jgi:hypothetical protein